MASARALIANVFQRLGARLPRALALTLFGMALLHGESAISASASEDIPFQELGGEQCFMFSRLVAYRLEGDHFIRPPFELIVNNEEDYRRLFEPRIRRQNCSGNDLLKAVPSVDFSRKTVLGLFSSGSCADTDLERQVSKDDTERWIMFSVTTVGSGIACSGPGTESLNLIAVPKVPTGYKVFFRNLHSHP